MAHYRVYTLCSAKRVLRGYDVECADDTKALEVAAANVSGNSWVEVWQASRCLGKISNDRQAQQANESAIRSY